MILFIFDTASFGAGSPAIPLQNPYFRHPSIPSSPYFHPMMHPVFSRPQMVGGSTVLPPSQPMSQPLGATKVESQVGRVYHFDI